MVRQATFFLSIFSFGVFMAAAVFWHQKEQEMSVLLFSRVVLADDGGEDGEDEEDKEDENKREAKNKDNTSKASNKVKIKESVITTYQLVEKTVTILDEKFRIDTDGDLLVDGLDPHPTVPESEYFTDDDEDAIPNAVDRYPGEDDFFVFGDEDDRNRDGLLDSFVATFGK